MFQDIKHKFTKELWCWRRLLRVPWTARRSNQPILKEISVESSLEGLMLKLKLQYFGHLMWRTDSGEDPEAGKDWRQEEKGTTDGWMASLTQCTWVWVSSRSWWWTGKPGMLKSMESQIVGHDWVTELNGTECSLLDWTGLYVASVILQEPWVHWMHSFIRILHTLPLLPLNGKRFAP